MTNKSWQWWLLYIRTSQLTGTYLQLNSVVSQNRKIWDIFSFKEGKSGTLYSFSCRWIRALLSIKKDLSNKQKIADIWHVSKLLVRQTDNYETSSLVFSPWPGSSVVTSRLMRSLQAIVTSTSGLRGSQQFVCHQLHQLHLHPRHGTVTVQCTLQTGNG